MARIISKEVRIGVDTLPEIKVAAKSCAGELGRRFKLNGQSLSLQGMLNALILDFIDQPRDVQIARMESALEKLNELQALDFDENRKLPTFRSPDADDAESKPGVAGVRHPKAIGSKDISPRRQVKAKSE